MAKKNEAALAKRGSSAITKWDEELAKHAQEVAAKEKMPSGNFVSIRGGIMSIAGSPIKDNKVQVLVVDHIYENAFYKGEYDSDNPQPPVCFAFGRDEDTLAPHDDCTEKQNSQCVGCPMNAFNTAEKGKGKACKNIRRLALISADGLSSKSALDGELVYMKLPVTSTKGWGYYVKGLANGAPFGKPLPPFGVITEIAVVPDPKTQVKVTFTAVGMVPHDVMGAVMQRREKVQKEIDFPYAKATETEAPAKKGKGKAQPAKARKF